MVFSEFPAEETVSGDVTIYKSAHETVSNLTDYPTYMGESASLFEVEQLRTRGSLRLNPPSRRQKSKYTRKRKRR